MIYNKKIRNKMVILVISNLLFMVLSGCVTIKTPLTGVTSSDFPYDLMISDGDFPQGWVNVDYRFIQFLDAKMTYSVGYQYKPEILGRQLSDQLSIFPNDESASIGYQTLEKKWFPVSDWKRPAGANFTPVQTGDPYILGCMEMKINNIPITSCRYLQKHDDLVVLILANMDNQTLTYKQFEAMLTSMDARFQGYKSK